VTGRRLAWLAGAACAIAGAACHGTSARPAAGEAARTAVVRRGDIVDRQCLTGELRAASSIGLTVPRTDAWQLQIRWLADDGALVLAGDKVVELDNSAFTAQLEEKHLAVLEAEMSLRSAADLGEIAIAAKDTELRQHQIALDKATVRAAVPADLLAGRDAQERQLEHKRAEVAADKAARELTAQRDEAALERRIKQIDLDKSRRAVAAAEKTIADLVLTAPRDGVIVIEDHPWLGRKIRAGDTVQPGMTLVSLPDLSQPMEVRAELSDVDDGRVAVGMTGTCALDAYPGDPLPCTVKDVTPVARSRNESSLRRAFAVELELGKTDAQRMRPGMSVKIELHPRAQRDAIIVPRGAIMPPRPGAPAGRSRVRLACGELREVTLGACDAQGCAAEAGVAPGDVVVVDAPGMPAPGGST
jgi:multidrug efflux pump subunit AcrA (membrane-fusion protein)